MGAATRWSPGSRCPSHPPPPPWPSPHARQALPGQPLSLRELPEPPDAVEARELLGDLVVADEDDVPGYSRAKFPHWITQYGTCDKREVTLQRDGQDDQCRVVSAGINSLAGLPQVLADVLPTRFSCMHRRLAPRQHTRGQNRVSQ